MQVLGITPYSGFVEYKMAKLSKCILRTMKAPFETGVAKHLAMLVSKVEIVLFAKSFACLILYIRESSLDLIPPAVRQVNYTKTG